MITKFMLDTWVENYANPYPLETFNEAKVETFCDYVWAELVEMMDEEDDVTDEDLAKNIYDDIADDIQNCGRSPMTKFKEQLNYLFFIKQKAPAWYETTLSYLETQINREIEELIELEKNQ